MMGQELVITDFGGIHNKNGDVTRSRLIKGGSWKRQRIIVIVPADSLIPAKCALAIWSLIFPPNNNVVRILAQGLEVGDAYSKSIEGVLAHPDLKDWEFVLCIEQDNAPPPDGVMRLVEALENHKELSAVGGLYFTKFHSGVAQIWGDPSDPVLNFRPQIPKPDCIQHCCGIGQGFSMFRLSMFKDPRLPRPLFQTKKGKDGVSTQDLSFWQNARAFGFRCAIDTGCKVGHYDLASDAMW